MSNPVFFATPEHLASAQPGDIVSVDGPEARHALTVKRLGEGEPVDLVDEAGTRVRGVVTGGDDGVLNVRVSEVLQEERPELTFTLVQALAKGDRDLQAIESATELGVHAIVPWQAERSIVRWKGERAARSQAKWQSTVRAAAKQSRRSLTPEVRAAVDTRTLATLAERAVATFVLHEQASGRLSEFGRQLAASGQSGEVLLVVGPEGGIGEDELARLISSGARAALLGETVLRSSSAGPAALAVLNALLGRW